MFNQEESQLLGLTKLESKLLNHLNDKPINVSDLAKKSKIKRTSLYSPLEHLLSRGFATKTKHGKRWLWSITPAKLIQEKLLALAENHRTTSDTRENEVGIIASQNSEYKIYRGKKKLNTIYSELLNLPKNTRLYGIQPNQSMVSALKNAEPDLIKNINESLKQKGVVVEAILAENFLPEYLKALGQQKTSPTKILKSFSGRLAITTYVPKDILNFNSELIFYNQTLLILNWLELSAVVIKNKDIVGIMIALFQLAKLSGSRVDQNAIIKKMITL